MSDFLDSYFDAGRASLQAEMPFEEVEQLIVGSLAVSTGAALVGKTTWPKPLLAVATVLVAGTMYWFLSPSSPVPQEPTPASSPSGIPVEDTFIKVVNPVDTPPPEKVQLPEIPPIPEQPEAPEPAVAPVPPSEPTAPALPSEPELPALPKEPELPALPSEPELPALPEPPEPPAPIKVEVVQSGKNFSASVVNIEEVEDVSSVGIGHMDSAKPIQVSVMRIQDTCGVRQKVEDKCIRYEIKLDAQDEDIERLVMDLSRHGLELVVKKIKRLSEGDYSIIQRIKLVLKYGNHSQSIVKSEGFDRIEFSFELLENDRPHNVQVRVHQFKNYEQ